MRSTMVVCLEVLALVTFRWQKILEYKPVGNVAQGERSRLQYVKRACANLQFLWV